MKTPGELAQSISNYMPVRQAILKELGLTIPDVETGKAPRFDIGDEIPLLARLVAHLLVSQYGVANGTFAQVAAALHGWLSWMTAPDAVTVCESIVKCGMDFVRMAASKSLDFDKILGPEVRSFTDTDSEAELAGKVASLARRMFEGFVPVSDVETLLLHAAFLKRRGHNVEDMADGTGGMGGGTGGRRDATLSEQRAPQGGAVPHPQDD